MLAAPTPNHKAPVAVTYPIRHKSRHEQAIICALLACLRAAIQPTIEERREGGDQREQMEEMQKHCNEPTTLGGRSGAAPGYTPVITGCNPWCARRSRRICNLVGGPRKPSARSLPTTGT